MTFFDVLVCVGLAAGSMSAVGVAGAIVYRFRDALGLDFGDEEEE